LVFVLDSNRFLFRLRENAVLESRGSNTSRSGSIGDVARLVRYRISGSRRTPSGGSSALSLESDRVPAVDRLAGVVVVVDVVVAESSFEICRLGVLVETWRSTDIRSRAADDGPAAAADVPDPAPAVEDEDAVAAEVAASADEEMRELNGVRL
jgi:hypothetical protein